MTGPAQQDQIRTALRYDSTVPRAMVHRSAIAEVFLTDSRPTDRPDTYEVAAQLPRAHIMGERSGTHDFLLLVEVLRQAGVYLAHAYQNVSPDDSFIFRNLRIRIRDLSAMRSGGERPAQAVTTLTRRPAAQAERTGARPGLLRDAHHRGPDRPARRRRTGLLQPQRLPRAARPPP
ncbi:hypothetical protein BKD26_10585 [Streptomyces sp. CB03238]|nr:hypothetical protein BKD26_10585 [Streptomyces sp. CB03238]